MKKQYVILIGLIFISMLSCRQDLQNERRPNFVLIMADDLGYEGIGCYGNTALNTPHLDQMAEDGLRFTDYHSNGSVCTPTRAALLTGRYQQRTGLEGVIYAKGPTRETGLDTSEITLARALEKGGYKTGVFGKWHLGYQKEFNPTHFGFDEFYGYVSGNVDFHSHFDGAGIYDWWHNTDTFTEEGYVTDLITDHAVNFIRENKDKPFFCYIPHEAPHVPFQGRNDPGYRYADNEFTYYGPVEDRDRAYKEMVEVMDEGVGTILSTLQELNLEENTLVVFISDNGGEAFGHNGPLNGDKGSLLEGGHRVPAIASWQGKIKPGVSEVTIMSFDWMPTFLKLANIVTASAPTFDGIDLSHHLLANDPVQTRDLFWRYRKEKAIRQAQFKLLIKDQDTLLFDLEKDIGEMEDLSGHHKTLVRELESSLMEWELEMDVSIQKTK